MRDDLFGHLFAVIGEGGWEAAFSIFFLIVILIVLALVAIAILLLAISVLAFIGRMLDVVFQPVHSGTAEILAKDKHEGEGYNFMYISNPAIMLLLEDKNSWHVLVRVRDCEDWVEINKQGFKKARIGHRAKITYRLGRFTDKLRIQDIWL